MEEANVCHLTVFRGLWDWLSDLSCSPTVFPFTFHSPVFCSDPFCTASTGYLSNIKIK